MRTFDKDLKEDLRDPESAAYFANAQVESGLELLRCGITNSFIYSSQTMSVNIKWNSRRKL